jgi:trehalose 6-phosphate synthase/phosphatase
MQPVQTKDFEEYLGGASTPSLTSNHPGKYVGHEAALALLLDYDGTLSPLASHPDLAKIPAKTKKVLENLANMHNVFVAIVSGRGVNNVKDMVGIKGITYAGNHGLEILHPDGTKVVHSALQS